MSSRVRRMALGLATLALLTSLFVVIQGFVSAPEALASCPEETWCDPPFTVDTDECCCNIRPWGYYRAILYRFCYWQEVDCTINREIFLLDIGCFGNLCWCE